jgi:hypothetical protein
MARYGVYGKTTLINANSRAEPGMMSVMCPAFIVAILGGTSNMGRRESIGG